jgi:hypothetical protein
MTSRTTLLLSFASFAILGSLAFVTPASALSMKECSAKYKAAQAANTLNGMKWNDFRAAQCGPDATPASGAAAQPATNSKSMAAAKPGTTAEPDPAVVPAKEPPKSTMAAPKGVVFPTAIAPKYASETPGKGRFHTCVDAYNENKAKNTLGGLKWIEKGGGFYSLCNTKLKG